MAEVAFSFIGPTGQDIHFRYQNEGGQSGRLDLRFSSSRIRSRNGTASVFSLSFNAIGKDDPLAFLESLDEGYLNDKVTGLSVRRHDLFKTVEKIRKVVQEERNELSADQMIGIEKRIASAAIGLADEHRLACQMLIESLRGSGVDCFADDPHHLTGFVRTEENIRFHKEIWPDLLLVLEHHICTEPGLDDRIEAVRVGRVPESPDPEAEASESEHPEPAADFGFGLA